MASDDDLENLHEDPRFEELMERVDDLDDNFNFRRKMKLKVKTKDGMVS